MKYVEGSDRNNKQDAFHAEWSLTLTKRFGPCQGRSLTVRRNHTAHPAAKPERVVFSRFEVRIFVATEARMTRIYKKDHGPHGTENHRPRSRNNYRLTRRAFSESM
jgi:hypothetical protein